MKKYIYLLLFIFLFVSNSDSQSWKRYPASLFYANGTNNYLGDLGGGKGDAAHFMGIRDFDIQSTRPTWQLGVRYRFHDFFVAKVNYTYALLSGSDASSGHYGRRGRDLSFRTGIYELAGQIEYYFVEEKGISKSSFGSLRAFSPLSAYVFVGAGGMFFNPKGYDPISDNWYSLQPLGTEGQYANANGTPYTYTNYYDPEEELQTPEPYKRVAFIVTMGLGIKYDINKLWAVGLEISNRYTSTDYLDDVHDRYFNYRDFGLTPPSDLTYYFSDKHRVLDYTTQTISTELAEPYHSGHTHRGSPNYNDAYILTMITLYYRLGNTSVAKPKYR